ncbi:hypothetical protein PbJCM13498_20050 [Prolixibacter bellariivorans]|uniref:Uncharacterized protein n=1 Tax=Prolixibacter bellariivorans TaxID=314319 RepID=A0A5M4AZ08_9BACT|nr:hypothetical protein PbJCM13498_20050 [Prolixibacter bellariivorans]
MTNVRNSINENFPGETGKYRDTKENPASYCGVSFLITSGYKRAAKLRLPEKKKGIANKIENG